MATNLIHFWREREIAPGKTLLWRLGNLRLWIQPESGAWRWAAGQGQTPGQMNASLVPNDVVPSALDWTRAALEVASSTILLQPQLPDRPLLARLRERISVPSGERVTVHCLVPVSVRLLLGPERASAGGQWPTRQLRGSWIGDNRSGVLAYALDVAAGPDWRALPVEPHHLIVPLRIENDSAEGLDFERLFLFPDNLGIFGTTHEMWSNEVLVSYRGSGRELAVRPGPTPPEAASGAKPLLAPVAPSAQTAKTVTFAD